MPILITAFSSLVLAWLRGAPPWELGAVRLRLLPLPLISFAIQLAVFVRLEALFATVAFPLHLLSLALLVVFLAANARYRALWIVGLGLLLNASVIAANGGYMPVRVADAHRIGFAESAAILEREGTFQKSTVLEADTPLWFLGDVIHLPLPYGPDRLISAGDVVLAIGAFLFIQEALVSERRRAL